MANLLRPTRGTISLFGRPLDAAPLYTPRQIGYMPQSGFALNNLTVGEALYFTAHLRGLSRADARAERDRLLATWDLAAIRDRVTQRLSGGQKRLVLLATTVAARPPVLILDEPTNDLDPLHRRLVWDQIRALNQAEGTTIVLVTHNVVEAERVISQVAILREGRLIAAGQPGPLKAALVHQWRLDVTFPPGAPPAPPPGEAPLRVSPGRWELLIPRQAALPYLDALAQAGTIEDFHLSTPTLEDLYLALTAEAAGEPAR